MEFTGREAYGGFAPCAWAPADQREGLGGNWACAAWGTVLAPGSVIAPGTVLTQCSVLGFAQDRSMSHGSKISRPCSACLLGVFCDGIGRLLCAAEGFCDGCAHVGGGWSDDDPCGF
jgi:hypothetical protein